MSTSAHYCFLLHDGLKGKPELVARAFNKQHWDISAFSGSVLPALEKASSSLCFSSHKQKEDSKQLHLIKTVFHRPLQTP